MLVSPRRNHSNSTMIERRCSFLVVSKREAVGEVEAHLRPEQATTCRCRCGPPARRPRRGSAASGRDIAAWPDPNRLAAAGSKPCDAHPFRINAIPIRTRFRWRGGPAYPYLAHAVSACRTPAQARRPGRARRFFAGASPNSDPPAKVLGRSCRRAGALPAPVLATKATRPAPTSRSDHHRDAAITAAPGSCSRTITRVAMRARAMRLPRDPPAGIGRGSARLHRRRSSGLRGTTAPASVEWACSSASVHGLIVGRWARTGNSGMPRNKRRRPRSENKPAAIRWRPFRT